MNTGLHFPQLERLLAGNRRFVVDKRTYPDQTLARRRELTAGQHPFAAILGCSDSRVPPELIFDQGLGDLFTVRVAGHVVDQATLGSLEYAVLHLDLRLIVVLGHSSCGAVQAALQVTQGGEAVKGRLAMLVAALQPAIKEAEGEPGEALDRAVRSNITMAVRQLRTAGPILAPLVEEGRIQILGACYDLATGIVELL